jgi:CheY-like chemotaxis protein
MATDLQPLAFALMPAKETVLVVDDSAEIRRYLATVLELNAYRVETAESGEEACQRVREGCEPALVLLDLQMSGMDGLATLRQLRELRPRLKVIMCSAVDDPDIVNAAAHLGAQGYLVKPIQHLYLSAAVESCLREGRPPNQQDCDLQAGIFPIEQPAFRTN